MNWKKYDFRKFLLVVILIIIVWVSIGVLISPKLNKTNTTLIKGHFDSIQKGIGSGRNSGCIWYDLYIREGSSYCRISADDSHCFLYGSFQNDVKSGEPIQIYINKPIPFFSIREPMVVAVIANGEEYLSFDCINNETDDERLEIPLSCLGIGVLIGLLLYKKELGIWFKNR